MRMKNIIKKVKRKLYFFSLGLLLKDYENGELPLTNKQKSQVEALMWKVKCKLI